jgi:hypothetical protein
MSKKEVFVRMGAAKHRDEIIQLVLDYMLGFCDRASFMVVRNQEIRGFEIKGDLTNKSAIRSFWLPLSSPSTLRRVVNNRQIHLGALSGDSADMVLSAAFGGRSTRVLAIPIEIRERVVGILYADKLGSNMPPWDKLMQLASAMGDNFMRLIIEKP